MSQNENGKALSDFNMQDLRMCNALNMCNFLEGVLC